ncbi:hypothetical protein OIU77_000537 [Salix suchowensis]|uniref:Uncharacterized protein n=1 Tax=Salix suchowensis TaxID=1278906 RepID=A0ABQ9B748_9ROSI|nr:hypothetical protein OIU77_000537 [Salix suchowensis]
MGWRLTGCPVHGDILRSKRRILGLVRLGKQEGFGWLQGCGDGRCTKDKTVRECRDRLGKRDEKDFGWYLGIWKVVIGRKSGWLVPVVEVKKPEHFSLTSL